MRKWIIFVSLFAVVLAAGVFGYLYEFGGLKYYRKALSYVETGETSTGKLYGSINNNIYGGIYAGVWFGRVGIWGRHGLRLFRPEQGTKLNFAKGCYGDYKESDLVFSEYKDISSWKKNIKVGDYTFVVYLDSDNRKFKTLWGADYWMFFGGELQDQCIVK